MFFIVSLWLVSKALKLLQSPVDHHRKVLLINKRQNSSYSRGRGCEWLLTGIQDNRRSTKPPGILLLPGKSFMRKMLWVPGCHLRQTNLPAIVAQDLEVLLVIGRLPV